YRDGRNPTFWCSIGVLYYQINQYRDALDAYSRAIRLNPYISEVWYDLGTLYESCNNQVNDALDAYTRALELDPTNPHIKQRLQMLRSGGSQGQGAVQPHQPTPQDGHSGYTSIGGMPPGPMTNFYQGPQPGGYPRSQSEQRAQQSGQSSNAPDHERRDLPSIQPGTFPPQQQSPHDPRAPPVGGGPRPSISAPGGVATLPKRGLSPKLSRPGSSGRGSFPRSPDTRSPHDLRSQLDARNSPKMFPHHVPDPARKQPDAQTLSPHQQQQPIPRLNELAGGRRGSDPPAPDRYDPREGVPPQNASNGRRPSIDDRWEHDRLRDTMAQREAAAREAAAAAQQREMEVQNAIRLREAAVERERERERARLMQLEQERERERDREMEKERAAAMILASSARERADSIPQPPLPHREYERGGAYDRGGEGAGGAGNPAYDPRANGYERRGEVDRRELERRDIERLEAERREYERRDVERREAEWRDADRRTMHPVFDRDRQQKSSRDWERDGASYQPDQQQQPDPRSTPPSRNAQAPLPPPPPPLAESVYRNTNNNNGTARDGPPTPPAAAARDVPQPFPRAPPRPLSPLPPPATTTTATTSASTSASTTTSAAASPAPSPPPPPATATTSSTRNILASAGYGSISSGASDDEDEDDEDDDREAEGDVDGEAGVKRKHRGEEEAGAKRVRVEGGE
ncbi:hypothetical protein BDK51DRAFT_25786, partial [Blyttiomyces helicus]